MELHRTTNYPYMHEEEKSLRVEFAPEPRQAKRKSLRMVLDFGSFGDVLGIEIMNLMLEAGKPALDLISQVVATTGYETRYSYDDESDSFYLRVHAGKSLNQKSVDGLAICDEDGRITELSAAWT